MTSSSDTAEAEGKPAAAAEPAETGASAASPESDQAQAAATAESAKVEVAAAAPEPEAAPGAPPPAKPKRRSPLMRALRFIALLLIIFASAVAGGFVARFVIPPFGPGVSAASNQIGDLKQQLAALQTKLQSADLPELDQRVAALEQKASAAPATPADVSNLASRLATAEQSIGALQQSVQTLQEQPALTAPSGPGVSQQTIDSFKAAASGLKSDIADLGTRLDNLASQLKSSDAAISARVAQLESQVPANLSEQLGQAASKGDLTALASRVAALESNTAAIDAKRAAASVALANLVRAASTGEPFTAELQSVELLDIKSGSLAALAPYAAKGVTPTSELAARFDTVARAAVRAGRSGGANWWSRFWANVANLFLVRRATPGKGNSVQAIVARAQAAAQAGDLRTAVIQLNALKGAPATAVATWKGEAQARLQLNALITHVSSELITALKGPGATP